MDNETEAERDENRVDGIMDADATGMVGSQAAIIHMQIEDATNAEESE